MAVRFLGRHVCEIHYREEIARFAEVRGRPVERNVSGTGRCEYGIRFETGTVGHIADEDMLELADANHGGEIGGNGEAAFVMDIGAGHCGPMDFAFKDSEEHAVKYGRFRMDKIARNTIAFSKRRHKRGVCLPEIFRFFLLASSVQGA